MQLLVICDNEGVVYVINKMTSSEVSLILKKLAVSLMQLNTVIRAKHVSGKSHVELVTVSQLC